MNIYLDELTTVESSLSSLTETVEDSLTTLEDLEQQLFTFYSYYMRDVIDHPLSPTAYNDIRSILGDSNWLIKDLRSAVSELKDVSRSLSVVLDNMDMGS